MGISKRGWLLVLAVLMAASAAAAKFDELFQPSWAADHVSFEGELLKLKLDNYSGAGFASKNKYVYGKTTFEIQLVPGDSAGTVIAFYMSSDGEKHNEFDFEFLGNTTGEPYLVQTNIYVDGVGNREQRLGLWFDPTADFHAYSITWTPRNIVFSVDDTPVRLHANRRSSAVPFPAPQPMGVYSSIWNADDWATQGGRVKTDWSHAPFVATYRQMTIDARDPAAAARAKVEEEELSLHQTHQLMWVRANHLVYDYCVDSARFPVQPPECRHR